VMFSLSFFKPRPQIPCKLILLMRLGNMDQELGVLNNDLHETFWNALRCDVFTIFLQA
jgi:hypothetical protein